ncbi:hypothetical protein EYF80_045341 [Liparis tanakae]|uniref:Uncharacterized protein n=1 Tax=Liparis tanakae TaxID=230148 RepID=A0A4Z2FUI4_9TELE|nr:hypothetical protein EYF80_045341 [Liparis tanakae]
MDPMRRSHKDSGEEAELIAPNVAAAFVGVSFGACVPALAVGPDQSKSPPLSVVVVLFRGGVRRPAVEVASAISGPWERKLGATRWRSRALAPRCSSDSHEPTAGLDWRDVKTGAEETAGARAAEAEQRFKS